MINDSKSVALRINKIYCIISSFFFKYFLKNFLQQAARKRHFQQA